MKKFIAILIFLTTLVSHGWGAIYELKNSIPDSSLPTCASGNWSKSGTTFTCSGTISLANGDQITANNDYTLSVSNGISFAGNNTIGSSSNTINLYSQNGSITISGSNNIVYGNIEASNGVNLSNATVNGYVRSTNNSVTISNSNITGNVFSNGGSGISLTNTTVTGNVESDNVSVSTSGGSITGNIKAGGSGLSTNNTNITATTINVPNNTVNITGGTISGAITSGGGEGVKLTNVTMTSGSITTTNVGVIISGSNLGSSSSNISISSGNTVRVQNSSTVYADITAPNWSQGNPTIIKDSTSIIYGACDPNYGQPCVTSILLPIADYRFDECEWIGTTGEVKDEIGDHNGTISSTTLSNDAKLIKSAYFNGNSSIEIGDIMALRNTASLSFWIKTTQRSNSDHTWGSPGLIGVEQSGGGDDIIWGFIDKNGKVGIDVGTTGSSYAISNTVVSTGQYYHVVLTRNKDNGEIKVYINGSQENSKIAKTGTIGNTFTKLGVIRDTGSTSDYLNATIDEVKIFDRVLSDTEILTIYNNESDGKNYDGTTRELPCCCVPTGGNLIANPSFETLCGTSIIQTWNTAGGIVNMRNNVCGWTMNGNGMETWENTTSPAANDGAVFVEIDGDGTTVDQLSQTIKTLNEIHYVISFDYRARNGGSDRIIAKWNGVEIDTFSGITSEWQTAQIEVVGTGSDTLAFEEPSADNNSYGSWIDNVRLIEGTLSPQNFGFDAWDSFRSISDRNISTKIVGKDFNLTIASLNDEKTGFQDFNGTVCVALVNNSAQPISGWNKLFFNDQNTSLATLVLDKAIGGDESAGVQITWKKNVDVLCPLVGESNSTIASDRFAVRPERFSITTLSNPIAGVDFNLTFSAPIFNTDTPASDYNETVGDTFDVTIAEQNASCITGVLTPNNLLFSFENGTRTLLTRYSEVGKLDINITETTKPCGSRFAQIDCDDANVFDGTALTQDILPIASENMSISVIPHHFDLNATLKNGNNTYTYLSTDLNMSASLDLLISAKNFQNEVTQNYSDACYAQSTSYTVDYAPLTISPSGSLKQLIYHYLDTENIDINETSFTLDANRSIFSAGEGSVSLNFNFDRNETKPVNPFTFTLNSVNVIDSDNVTGEDPTDQNATFVFGRTHAYDMTTNDTEAPNPIEIEIYGKNSSHSFLVGKPQNTIYWYRNTDHNGVLGGAVLSGDDYPSTTKTAGASSSIVVTTTTPPAGGLQWINIQNNDSITTPKTIHLNITPWLWYSSLQSYSDPDGSNCTQHPCFKYTFTIDSSSTTTPFRGSDFNIAPAQDVTQKGAKFFR